jgi:SAM-dependent methyltransferase
VTTKAGSYTSGRHGLATVTREARELYRVHSVDVAPRVARLLEDVREVEARVESRFGLRLDGKRVLEIGCGQHLVQLAYFAARNDAVGIDLDVIVRGFDPLGYARMLRVNGARRTAKTAARKLLQLDAGYAQELKRQLRLQRLPRLRVLQMDAAAMSFPDASFDFVYCYSVFHHLPDPAAALAEIRRVLAPGGVAFVSFQLYTSETGSLDPRLFSGRREEIPLWAHLRPDCADAVVGNAYLNKLRLDEWRAVLSAGLPGCELVLDQPDSLRLEPEARSLQAAGELAGYALDELLTHRLVVLARPA